jgi:hypothetical protein
VLQESVFTTTDLPPADRFEAWTQRMGRTHAPMRLTSEHTADYHGHQRMIALGDVLVWPATFDQLAFHRTPKLIRQSDPEAYHVSLLLKGEGAADWGRWRAAYGLHDFHASTSSRPFEVATGPEHRADQVVGRRITGREGIGALLAQFLLRLVADTSCYQPSDAARLGTVVADLTTAVFAHAVDTDLRLPPETHSRTLVLRVKAYVRRHLDDPELTPARIAAAHNISRR